jgi:hypothetical protein
LGDRLLFLGLATSTLAGLSIFLKVHRCVVELLSKGFKLVLLFRLVKDDAADCK